MKKRAFQLDVIALQVAIFCEGTRYSQDKYLQGVEYAKTAGLTPLKYHLVPRTKEYKVHAQKLSLNKISCNY